MKIFKLLPHPTTPCSFIDALEVTVEWSSTGDIRCVYQLRGDIDQLALPAIADSPARTDELWRHTCFEIFLKQADDSAYDEFNFSPSGNWAAYRFGSYRNGMTDLQLGRPPQIASTRDGDRLELESGFATSGPTDSLLQMALSTVLKDKSGNTSYWALQHPPGKPDFHADVGFAATLAKS